MTKPENPEMFRQVGNSGEYVYATDITLRDVFAGVAMERNGDWIDYHDEALLKEARHCYRIADAMLKARES